MKLSESNSEETNLEHNIEILNELIQEEIHWFLKFLNFFKMLKIC